VATHFGRALGLLGEDTVITVEGGEPSSRGCRHPAGPVERGPPRKRAAAGGVAHLTQTADRRARPPACSIPRLLARPLGLPVCTVFPRAYPAACAPARLSRQPTVAPDVSPQCQVNDRARHPSRTVLPPRAPWTVPSFCLWSQGSRTMVLQVVAAIAWVAATPALMAIMRLTPAHTGPVGEINSPVRGGRGVCDTRRRSCHGRRTPRQAARRGQRRIYDFLRDGRWDANVATVWAAWALYACFSFAFSFGWTGCRFDDHRPA